MGANGLNAKVAGITYEYLTKKGYTHEEAFEKAYGKPDDSNWELYFMFGMGIAYVFTMGFIIYHGCFA